MAVFSTKWFSYQRPMTKSISSGSTLLSTRPQNIPRLSLGTCRSLGYPIQRHPVYQDRRRRAIYGRQRDPHGCQNETRPPRFAHGLGQRDPSTCPCRFPQPPRDCSPLPARAVSSQTALAKYPLVESRLARIRSSALGWSTGFQRAKGLSPSISGPPVATGKRR